MRHTGAHVSAILLKLFGAILTIAGLAGLLIGLSSMGTQTPDGSSYINAFMANFAVFGSISAIGTGFTLMVFGQMLELMIHIAKDIRIVAQNSAETTAFFSRVAKKTAP